ncbi:Envelope-like protein [Abeliophyllum distichum]|uniref:Envelope-like protein n=1 Tax=Abeliophyllum distichum TaxID=126358 RepID=A0ABD1PS62_9LAMI
MPPKRKAIAQENRKGKVSGPSTRTRHVAEPPDDGDIPRFQTEAIQARYKSKWTPKVCHKERQVTRDDFFHHLLEQVIQHCRWHKVVGAPYVAYPTLVREFFVKFNPDIDVSEHPNKHKTWVRGQWIRFSPTMIDRYYGLTRTGLDPLPSPYELDMALVARYLYGRDDAWPLDTPRFMYDQLTMELWVLHIFVSSNISPTCQRTQFNEHRVILLYHLAQLCKFDLGAHIFEFIKELATESLFFPPRKADPPAPFLNARSVENSKTKIAAGRNRVQAVPPMNACDDYPDEAALVPPPALAVGSDLSIQLVQLLAAQTEMVRAFATI